MFRLTTCLLILVACHGSNPPAEPAPAPPTTPQIDGDIEPSTLPPEPNSPSDPQTMAPAVGAIAKTESGSTTPAQTGGLGGAGGFGGMSGTGGTAPVRH